MLTNQQINQLIEVADAAGYGITEANVVQTRETINDFQSSFNGLTEEMIELESGETFIYHYVSGVRATESRVRGDLIVMDFGDARAAYFSGQ